MIQEYFSKPVEFNSIYNSVFISSKQYVHKVNIPEVNMFSNAFFALKKIISEDSYFSSADVVRVFNINFNPYIIRIGSLRPVSGDVEKYIDIVLLDTVLHFEPDLLSGDMEKIDSIKKDYLDNKDSTLRSIGFSLLRQILSKIPIQLIYCK